MPTQYILAFGSSCDDTSVAILDINYNVLVNLISSQPEHLEFGGILRTYFPFAFKEHS